MKIRRGEENLLSIVSNVPVERWTAKHCAVLYYCNAITNFMAA